MPEYDSISLLAYAHSRRCRGYWWYLRGLVGDVREAARTTLCMRSWRWGAFAWRVRRGHKRYTIWMDRRWSYGVPKGQAARTEWLPPEADALGRVEEVELGTALKAPRGAPDGKV